MAPARRKPRTGTLERNHFMHRSSAMEWLSIRTLRGGGLLFGILAVTAAAQTGQTGQTPAAGSGDGFLSGTGSWDYAVVREYFKKEHVELSAQPPTFIHQEVLDKLNSEFALRAR